VTAMIDGEGMARLLKATDDRLRRFLLGERE
jgi:hypothetical protein